MRDITKILFDAIKTKIEKWRTDLEKKSFSELKEYAKSYNVFIDNRGAVDRCISVQVAEDCEDNEFIDITMKDAKLKVMVLKGFTDDNEEIWENEGVFHVANPDFLEDAPKKVIRIITNDIKRRLDERDKQEEARLLDREELEAMERECHEEYESDW